MRTIKFILSILKDMLECLIEGVVYLLFLASLFIFGIIILSVMLIIPFILMRITGNWLLLIIGLVGEIAIIDIINNKREIYYRYLDTKKYFKNKWENSKK